MLHSPLAVLGSPYVGAFWKHSCPSLLRTWLWAGHSLLPALGLVCLFEHCRAPPVSRLVAQREESIAGTPGPLSSGKPPFCPTGQPAQAPGVPAGQALPCGCARCPCRPPSLHRSQLLLLIASPSCLCPQEVCTLLLAAHLLGDQISLLNWLGFALCLSGISLHVALKALRSRGNQSPSQKPLFG